MSYASAFITTLNEPSPITSTSFRLERNTDQHCSCRNVFVGAHNSGSWWRGSVVERRSLAGELSLSCARPAADG